MFVLQPSSSVCYPLNLPIAPGPNLDEATRKKLTLECRTGAAVELARSGVFVHGGLTLPLNLPVINSLQLQKELILYFGKHKNRNTDFKTLADWISPEIFFLDLISRTWQRIITTIDTATGGDSNSDLHFKERLLHSMCFTESNIYIFGGLIVSPQNGYELIGTNELWKLDLKTKCWSLLSKNPQITRRFNHNMHILNENNENQDTKLVIVGGLDNMDIPIKKIDIFNLRTNAWESESKAGTIPDSKPPTKIWVNIDGMPISLSHDSNFSVLIENNEAEVPTLALYYPQDMTKTSRRGTNDDSFSNYTHIADEQSRVPKHPHHSHGDLRYLEEEDTESDSIKTLMSPIVILPLLAKSEGARMTSNPTQNNKGNSILQIPFHLQYPSGNYFNYNIVVIGFYPDPQPSNLHCFIYNIASGKWIKVNISCTECSTNMHRFWKLLIWKSHHQALLLGTKSNDFCSPSVQKFDHILAFSLPMLNGYNKLINEKNSGTSNNVAINCNPKLNLSLYDHLPYPTSPITDQESSHTITQAHTVNDSRLPDLTSSATSQFENYSRYITVPLEMESTSSIFPSYAMVLGKDALEIFGETLSDFEFITADGDSIGVPVYLLRKRWGRYFDSLLSNGYANTSFNYEFNGDPSNIISFSPLPVSKGAKFDYSNQSSNGSLEKFFSKRDNSKSNSNINFKKPHSVDLTSSRSSPKQRALSHSRTSPLEPAFLTNDEEDRTNTSKREEIANNDLQKNSISNKKPTSTTCSSTGMVFRVPFQDIKNSKLGLSEQSSRSTRANSASPPPVHEKSIHYGSISNDMLSNTRSSYRGASTVGATRNNSIDDVYSSIRRASHPLQSHIVAKSSPNSISNPSPEEESSSRRKSSALRFIASPHKSRQPSFASTTSTASVVSSTSGRRRNSNQVSHLRSSSSSPVLPVLNILLPPQEKIPLEPLPPVPNVPSRRSSSLADYVQFSRDSPTASRGSSHSTRKSSCSDMRRVSNSSLLRSTLDSQLLNSSCGNDIPYEASIEEYGMINGRGEEGDEDNGDYNSFLPSNIRPVFSTINAVSINGDFKEGELISAKSYINSEKGRRLSYISNPESVESTNSNNNAIIELEPLLTPRSLYMPWSTASVRAFAEFFYTARINGKWLLAPVTLDLLIMAKTYEIPILYELITEVLYKITSKKEESLLVTCEALLNLFQSKISRYCNENEGKIRRMLDSNESYQDILEIKRSLVNIDNGYIDSYLLRNTSMAQSTDDSNVDTETTDMQHTRVSSLGSLANRAVPTVFAGGPRDSHNSIGSIAFPNSSSVQNFRRSVSLFSPTVKKKSSLSKETDPLDTYDEDAGDMHDSEMVKQHPNPPSTNGINPFIRKTSVDPTDKSLNEFDVGSRSGKPSYDRKEQIEQATLQGISNLDKSKISTSQSGSSGDEKDLQGANGVSKSSDTQKIGSSSNMKTDPFARDEFDSDSGSSSHSDSDDLDSQLGILPFTKMNKKLQEQTSQEFDDSIDPLYKISSSTPGSSRIHGSFSKYIRPSSQREDAPEYTNISSLENMVSPNALPPVDYVMKSIYRVSVLVNDKNLMIRTKEAIGLSKILKKLKKKVLQDISRMDDELREAGKPVDIYPRGSSSPTLSRQHSDITTFIKQQGNARPSLKLATSSPISEAFKKTSSKFIQPGSAQISPRTSVGDFTASQQRRQHMNKRFSTQTTHSTSALFMNPAIMPPAVNAGHRESEEENGEGFVAATKTNKREDVPSIDNDNSGNVFPFFGKRK